MAEPPEQFLKRLQQDKISRVPGTAVFLTGLADGTPPLMIEHVAQIGALDRNLIALTVKFEDVPRERSADRLKMVKVSDNFLARDRSLWLCRSPRPARRIARGKSLARDIDLDKAVYFAARDEAVHSKTGATLSWWRVAAVRFPIPELGPGVRPV